jgi:hypothetical protein
MAKQTCQYSEVLLQARRYQFTTQTPMPSLVPSMCAGT